ncbi:hypothetical protein ACH4JS_35835 [Streptomyces sp. NPDC017638]|uniref:hypothetical protein n=1 Tax=Streptomyces sp. NPDC017638 TaxID=3365004 RepID=UPI0037945A47
MVTERMIGKAVTDGERVGILQDIIRDWGDPAEMPGQRKARLTAFVRARGGGREWTAPPSRLDRL